VNAAVTGLLHPSRRQHRHVAVLYRAIDQLSEVDEIQDICFIVAPQERADGCVR